MEPDITNTVTLITCQTQQWTYRCFLGVYMELQWWSNRGQVFFRGLVGLSWILSSFYDEWIFKIHFRPKSYNIWDIRQCTDNHFIYQPSIHRHCIHFTPNPLQMTVYILEKPSQKCNLLLSVTSSCLSPPLFCLRLNCFWNEVQHSAANQNSACSHVSVFIRRRHKHHF